MGTVLYLRTINQTTETRSQNAKLIGCCQA
jgi:hypothetical protein